MGVIVYAVGMLLNDLTYLRSCYVDYSIIDTIVIKDGNIRTIVLRLYLGWSLEDTNTR
jgi:hypothetical protein